jgi:phosphoserine phosphatase
MQGRLEREFADRCRDWVAKDVLPLVVPGAREKIEKHRATGTCWQSFSTSPTYVTQPMAEALGIEEVIVDAFEVERWQFTGRLVGPACVGTRQGALGRGPGRAARSTSSAELVLHGFVHGHAACSSGSATASS